MFAGATAAAAAAAVIVLALMHAVSPLSQDGLYLKQIKQSIADPYGQLDDWSDADATPCDWPGITCDDEFFVDSISLTAGNLSGPFPSPDLLCRLPRLAALDLSDNYFNGTVPDDPLFSLCGSLVELNLAINEFVGAVPAALYAIPKLRYLDLSYNNFSGEIPKEFAGFRALEQVSLVNNLLDGSVPAVFGDIPTLRELNLSYNPFAAGEIPAGYAGLVNLEVLWMGTCNLVGKIPAGLGGLRRLRNLDLANNRLVGEIPASLTGMVGIVQIELFNNSLSGRIPAGWSKAANLRRLDASMNMLGGEIPADLCALPLESLNLYENRLSGGLPAVISQSPNLYELRLFSNRLAGAIPAGLGKNSSLRWVDLSSNNFTGEIPAGICDKGALEQLLIIDNQLNGSIPASLGKCRSLVRVRLFDNQLSGEVPQGVWALPNVWLLDLAENRLSSGISPAIAGARNLSVLLLGKNRFNGSIPPEVRALENLETFSAGGNQLSGGVPSELGKLPILATVDLSSNQLSGQIPANIGSWKKLTNLYLASNLIAGGIPPAMGSLPLLNNLDLSGNKLTGKVPVELQNLTLNSFNLSDNLLTGQLPPLFANEKYKSSFLNNPGLCGDIPGLCPASRRDSGKTSRLGWLLPAICVVLAFIFVVGIGMFLWRYNNFKKQKNGKEKLKRSLTSFYKLGFGEDEIFESLDEDNVIGRGSSGQVYKVVLNNGEAVAVKKLHISAGSKEGGHEELSSFEAEVQTLGRIRHKNIVRLLCACTSKDCKLLVYDYMPNGSLGNLLHGTKGGLLLWKTRLNIALDVAEGLSYLHHDCVPAIVHRDVKSNNILLDADYGARLADFGIAKMLETIGKRPKSMTHIAGSCGYIAPEYAYNPRVNEKSDIYSFGVVILELVTGRLPLDPEYGEKDLVKWVCSTLEQKDVEHLFDTRLDLLNKEQISSVLKIGLLCTNLDPKNRPPMRRVVKMLIDAGGGSQRVVDKGERLTSDNHDDASDQSSGSVQESKLDRSI